MSRYRRRRAPVSRSDEYAVHIGKCLECGKHRFLSRNAVRRAVKARYPHERNLTFYQCGEYWHYGHGTASRTRNLEPRKCHDSTTHAPHDWEDLRDLTRYKCLGWVSRPEDAPSAEDPSPA